MLCKVCQFTKVGHGSVFCEACRSFYIRNQKRGTLPCKKKPNFKCLSLSAVNESVDDFVTLSKSNQNRRLLCSGCRLAKCRKILAENRGSSKSAIVNDSMVSKNAIQNETILKLVIKASEQLSENLDKLSIRSTSTAYPSSQGAFHMFLSSTPQQILEMKKYANCFPFHLKLDVVDRVSLVLSTKNRLIVGENLIKSKDLYIGCMSSACQKEIYPYVHSIGEVRRQGLISREKIKRVLLSTEEQAFLLAFLYFDGNFFIQIC